MSKDKLAVTLITGRSLLQGMGKEMGKTTKRFYESVSVCEMDPDDLDKLGIKEAMNVRVTTQFGTIVLKAVSSRHAPHRGIIFIPYGPYANVLTDHETQSSGMPTFKGLKGEVEPTLEDIPDLQKLLKTYYER